MSYVTPEDMKELYEEVILVQATNYSNRTANLVNEEMLQRACNHGNYIVDGHMLHVNEAAINERLYTILKVHAGRIAMDVLAGTDPQIREQAKESIEWLKSLRKLSGSDDDGGGDIPGVTSALPVITFNEGRRWEVHI